jgi:hypothetical protein
MKRPGWPQCTACAHIARPAVTQPDVSQAQLTPLRGLPAQITQIRIAGNHAVRSTPTAHRRVRARQPPPGQAQFRAYCLCFFEHDAVRFEQGVNIPGGTARVVSEGHRSAAEHVDVCYHAALRQPVAEPPEGLLDALAVEQGRMIAHAASIS